MSEQTAPLTYEGILELFRQAHLRMDRMSEEVWAQIKRTDQKVSSLGSRVGEIVENMVGGDIVEQFQTLGYAVTFLSRNIIFGMEGTKDEGEIDLLLQDGDIAILIEAKTTLTTKDVLEHIERLEKYRAYLDRTGKADRWQLIGAVATASARPDVVKFAQRKGFYVIIQAGRTVEIVTPPEGFVAKKW